MITSFFKGLILLVSMVYVNNSYAHTVSFKGAYALNLSNKEDMSMWGLNYSTTSKTSIGTTYYRFKNNSLENRYYFLQGNVLLKRFNELKSQGNIYLSLGHGLKEGLSSNQASLAALEADWESREYYIAAKSEVVFDHKNDRDNVYFNKLRFGFAPYLAEFEELNTWIILEAKHVTKMKEEFSLTPIVRLFYRNVLMEFGVSHKGMSEFNLMVHF